MLKCLWEDGALVCDVTEGVEFNRHVTDRLTVTILQTNHNNAGTYMCQLHNSTNNAALCDLLLGSVKLLSH